MTTAEPFHVLMSYWLLRDASMPNVIERDLTVNGQAPVVFADSGAFTAYTEGRTIDVGAYADWLHAHRALFNVYANLDVIGDYRRTADNQAALEARGLWPMPVWHAGEPVELLRDYCQGYRYVAIGGVAKRNMGDLGAHLVRWFRIAAEHDTVLHGFGMTDRRGMADFPWYSVDSTSFTTSYRFGRVAVFDPTRGSFVTFGLHDRAGWGRYGAQVRRWGLDPEHFLDREKYHHHKAIALAILEWRECARWVRRRQGDKPLLRLTGPPELVETTPGIHVYAAEGSPSNLADAALAWQLGRYDAEAFAIRRRDR